MLEKWAYLSIHFIFHFMVKLYQIILWMSVVYFYSQSFKTFGQEGTIKGQVKAQEDGTGLPGVNVLIKGTGKGP